VSSTDDSTVDVSPAHGFQAASMPSNSKQFTIAGYGVLHKRRGSAWKYLHSEYIVSA
jgi:hypothetical protein